MKSAFLRSAAIYSAANVISAGVPFLLLPILTRALTPTQYGEVVSFYILTAVCSSIAGLSLHGAIGVRWLNPSRGDPRSFTASAMLLAFATTGIAAMLAAALAPAFGIDLAPGVCALAAVLSGANVVQGMRFAVWQSCERPVPAATLQLSAASLNIALSLLGVFVLHLGGLGRIYGAVLAGLLVCALCAYSLFSERSATGATAADTRSLLRFGLPLVPHVLAGALLTSADRFAVAAKLGPGALGIYGVASQLGLVIAVFADAATKAYTPAMYRMLSRGGTRSRLRIVAITYLTIPGWLLVALVLWMIYLAVGDLLLGDQYRGATDLAIWFLLGGAAGGVYLNIAGLFFFTNKTEWISVATVSASAISLALSPYSVSRFGLVGGGAAFRAAQLMLLTAAWSLSMRINPMPWGRPSLALRVLFRQKLGTR